MATNIEELSSKAGSLSIDWKAFQQWNESLREKNLRASTPESIANTTSPSPRASPAPTTPYRAPTPFGNILKLNIGGMVFQTTKATLAKYDGILKTMLETNAPIEKDESGAIFIDRDPYYFRYILNYMRDGFVEFPNSLKELKEIQTEAQHYQLDGLIALCMMRMDKMEKTAKDEENKKKNQEKQKAALAKKVEEKRDDIQVLETDGQLFKVIAKADKPTIVIYYLIDGFGTFVPPKGFYMDTFVERYKKKLDIYFKPVTDDQAVVTEFGSPSFCWRWSLHDESGAYLHSSPKYEHNGWLKTSFMSQLGNSIAEFLKN
ncbi:hypothetical protein B9Z55_027462 [Caenorhabditis nigoni]|uniref:BTB domain-containing protein n=1 Tax=Caenorhabditis nigoni TaxID=1611254 RepID=A0A2G5SFP2_9PELO|nr:hypothetical protein B9Z55_027462 [Caenorhabditis nigoni]